jgi:hypothetical protein
MWVHLSPVSSVYTMVSWLPGLRFIMSSITVDSKGEKFLCLIPYCLEETWPFTVSDNVFLIISVKLLVILKLYVHYCAADRSVSRYIWILGCDMEIIVMSSWNWQLY